MSSATADPPPAAPKLSDADRSAMLAGVERMIYGQIRAFGIPAADVEDVAQDCRLVLWKVSGTFDPAGWAKWSTFAKTCIDNVLKNRRGEIIQATIPGGRPTVQLDDAMTADPATVSDPDDEDDDEPGADALTAAVRRQLLTKALAGLTTHARGLVTAVVLDGLTAAQVADQHGVHPKMVALILRAALGKIALAGHLPAGLAERFGLSARDLATNADARARRENATARQSLVGEALTLGLAVVDIAAGLGVTPNTVQADIRATRRGASPKRGGRESLAPQVREQLARGASPADIAADLGCTKSTVYRHARAGEPAALTPAV